MKAFLVVLALAAGHVLAAEEEGFVSLFNGRDLTGWVNVNCAPETWSVRDGLIHCTGHPTGALRTPREYENFILELEWRHLSSGGNSGVFIWASPIAAPGVPFLRGIEVQVLDHGFNVPGKNQWYTTHGDVFPIHGATMKPFGRHNGMRSFPSEERSKGTPEWNHYRIVCDHGVIRLHVNGKEVSGGEECNYRKGYLGLESEGAPVEFRNIRIKELPPSGATVEQSAPEDLGWRPLFTGLDFRGWQTNASTAQCWQVQDEEIRLRADHAELPAFLWTERVFVDAEFVIDCRPFKKNGAASHASPVLRRASIDGPAKEIKLEMPKTNGFQRFVVTVKGREMVVHRSDAEIGRLSLPPEAPAKFGLGLSEPGGAFEFMNLYVRDLRGGSAR
jgi:hypothetical protein